MSRHRGVKKMIDEALEDEVDDDDYGDGNKPFYGFQF